MKERRALTDAPMKVAILISGRGSNMVALAKAIAKDDFPAKVVGVIADQTDAGGLELAQNLGLETAAIPKTKDMTKHDHEALIQAQLEAWGAEIVCLAGYMRLLSADFIEKCPARFINIHPSLLPKFKGLDTHARVLEAGDPEHGCTVHYVTAGMDEGPVIAQARVDVRPDDTVDTLTARVLEKEHALYASSLRTLIENFKAKRA